MQNKITQKSLEEKIEQLNNLFKEIAKEAFLLNHKEDTPNVKTLLAMSIAQFLTILCLFVEPDARNNLIAIVTDAVKKNLEKVSELEKNN